MYYPTYTYIDSVFSFVREPENEFAGFKSIANNRELLLKKMSEIAQILKSLELKVQSDRDLQWHLISAYDLSEAILRHYKENHHFIQLEVFNHLMLMINEFRLILFKVVETGDKNSKIIYHRTKSGQQRIFLYFSIDNELDYEESSPPNRNLTNLERSFQSARIRYIKYLDSNKLQKKLSLENKLNNFMAFVFYFSSAYKNIKVIRNDIQHSGQVSRINSDRLNDELIRNIVENFMYNVVLRVEELFTDNK